MKKTLRHVLTIGGGSGQFALLSGLRDMAGINITAVVSMVDSGKDFVKRLEAFIERPVDGVIHNTRKPGNDILKKYKDQTSEFVTLNEGDPWWGNRAIHGGDLIDTSGGIVRHDAKKLACLIQEIILKNAL